MSFKLCMISENYINYLKKYDTKVPNNYNERRPYIGIVLIVKEHIYFAPLSSPKEKHTLMKDNRFDIEKIDGGKYGIINFNNMIPITENQLINFEIEKIQDLKYKKLLKHQYEYCSRNEMRILHKANKIYKYVVEYNTHFYTKISCDFKLLEEKLKEYENNFK